MANYRVILYAREKITDTATTLSANNDKRKALLDRFTLANITIKQMSGNTPTKDEMETWYNELTSDVSLNDSDLIIYVDEKAISSLDSTEIDSVLQHIENTLMSEVDVFYLANFMDNCRSTEALTATTESNITQIDFYKAKAPNGLYAIASTKAKWPDIFDEMDGRKELRAQARITNLVINKTLVAGTTWPRIFTVDINRMTENVENLYTYPCRYEPEFGKTVPNTEHMAFYWFVLGLVLIVLTAWILTKIAPRNRVFLYKK